MPKQAFVMAVGLATSIAPLAVGQSYPTERVSIDGFDIQADRLSRELEPSADGRFVAFVTLATNFSEDDPDARFDIFVRDRFERTLELVSIGSAGEVSDGDSRFPSISADGRFVAFETTASTFFPLDDNAQRDVYLRDRHEGTTTLVSRGMSGSAGNGSSGVPSVSNDGRWIAFVSDATDLVPGDTNGQDDVFLYDALFGAIRRVSLSETGAESGGGVVGQPAMSADGKIIAFASRASDIVAGDPANFVDIFVYDRCSGAVELVSRTPDGDFPDADSFSPSISASGRFIAFSSQAENLTEEPGNGFEDIFLYDRQKNETILVSVSTEGEPAAGDSFSPSIDAAGDTVIFASSAFNLVPDDPDGSTFDLYAREIPTETTTRQSLTWRDEESLEPIVAWRLADLGGWAGFTSEDGALAPDDSNGLRDAYLRWIGDPCLEREPNDRFIDRTWINLDNNDCPSISGKLETRPFEGPEPDTFLFAFDKQDNVIATDDNSSSLGNGKASALWLEPVLDPDDGTTTIRLAVTGRPDGLDNRPNGLFFNAPHGQIGAFSLTVRYVDEDGLPVLDECEEVIIDGASSDAAGRPLAFVTGAELFRLNFFPPPGAAMAHVEIDNTVGRVDQANDVDHFAFAGLPALCDVAITVLGCINDQGRPEPVRLGWFTKEGELVETVIPGSAEAGPLTLRGITDANGRINIAITGLQDEDFDGLFDDIFARNIQNPGYDGPVGHGAACCYSLLVEPFENGFPKTPAMTPEEQLAQGDLNLDGGVDIVDLSILLNSWGWRLP
jgi:Tol biopolymer transport system component